MAQSSNYKQYARATRVLTEESGFSGGMLWTGNNIDETHLKAIVNCDYDDTTGYLKTRDPFISKADAPQSADFKGLNLNLTGYSLLGTYTICAYDPAEDELLGAGQLYIFTNEHKTPILRRNSISSEHIICVYSVNDHYYKCSLNVNESVVLHNITASNILINYENQLFGLGQSNTEGEWLCVYRVERYYGTEDVRFEFKQLDHTSDIKPKIDSVTLLEACVSGFNAARGKETFTYSGTPVDTQAEQSILGVYLKDTDGNIVVSPHAGQTVEVHVPVAYFGDGGCTYNLAMFQLKESGDSTVTTSEDVWQYLQSANIEYGKGEFVFKIELKQKKTTLAFTYYGTNAIPETAPVYSENAVDYFAPYVITAGNNLDNLKLKNYDLSTSDGSCVWRNRLCVWSTQSSSNCLFFSEVDNFYYYPIPQNVAVFDTNVISCIPYKDSLLVFTADKIHRVSENNDGTFTQTVVQNDMPLSKNDSAHLTAIKNMVLFKSGNYFYMIVPKSQSLTDELSIAPIYKNIAGFLNTLDKSIQEVLQLLYPEYLLQDSLEFDNTPSAVYTVQDTVHILYDVTAPVTFIEQEELKTDIRRFKLFLNYNTNLRAWSLYLEDTTDMSLEVSSLTPDRLMSFVRIYKQGDNKGLFDVVTQQAASSTDTTFRVLLDTGYRTLSSTIQKRFREVQLKLYNASESVTAFGTAFLVDGVWRRNYTKLQETVTDSGTISLTPTLDINTFITELTMPVPESGDIIKDPGSDSIELSNWTLDFSHFKREAPVTVRVPVSGKGFNPRFIFMIPNAVGVTINEINWVYRLMHGR